MSDTLPADASPEVRFFFDKAGYIVGERYECAVRLATAEAWIKTQRHTFSWQPSDLTWDGDSPLPEGCLHEDCYLVIRFKVCPCCGADKVKHRESLSSNAFMPYDAANYRRIVEAELALEAMQACQKET